MCDEYLNVWRKVRKKSAEAGLYTMHMPEEVGGFGLDILPFTQIIEYIETRNPEGFHSFMWNTVSVTEMMLPAAEDEYQRERYFEPMMSGEKLSAFALTEPDHGSDATFMDMTAEKDGDEWIIDGEKAFITFGAVADFVMVHARTSGDAGDIDGITTFLVDADSPGFEVEKVQRPTGGQPGRQAILRFDNSAMRRGRLTAMNVPSSNRAWRSFAGHSYGTT
jgi:acyl-CoA dehydrogenase